jgi:hypothetical protein
VKHHNPDCIYAGQELQAPCLMCARVGRIPPLKPAAERRWPEFRARTRQAFIDLVDRIGEATAQMADEQLKHFMHAVLLVAVAAVAFFLGVISKGGGI